MSARTSGLLLLVGVLLLAIVLAFAQESQPPPPDFVPLSELEAARLETIRLKVQIVNGEVATLAQRAADAQKIDRAQYEFNFERGGFVRKGSAPSASSSAPLAPTGPP